VIILYHIYIPPSKKISGKDADPPPPLGADHAGTPEVTVRTKPSVPIPNLAGVLEPDA
jgi:hypothetical protein